MKILLLGNGGREHALAWKMAQSPKLEKLFIAPGNAGTRNVGENVDIDAGDFPAIERFVIEKAIDMVVVGPEVPLVDGIVDHFALNPRFQNVKVIGPSKSGARLEGSKDFAKGFMIRHNIPTALYKTFDGTMVKEGLNFLSTMTLCHNGDNLICDSAQRSTRLNDGVSEFGEKVIFEMNRVGMMVDLSHGGEKSFWNALEISKLPIVCTHSSCKRVCNHPRNLSDEQLKALAVGGGVCQITLYSGFLCKDGRATINDVMEHLEHAVNLIGVDHVGLGTDFDGDGGVPGLANASELINFTRQLLRLKFNEEEIKMIWGGNFLRVMKQVQEAAKA